MTIYPEPKKFPVSIKSIDILNTEDVQFDRIHTFQNQEEYTNWLEIIKNWNQLSKRPSKLEIMETVEDETLIVENRL